ncbi:MAG: protein-disulfide reductase DsbD, partial [Trinickia sp.]
MFKPLFDFQRMLVRVLALALAFAVLGPGLVGAARADDFLDPSAAFRFSADERPNEVDVHFKIADGYYL